MSKKTKFKRYKLLTDIIIPAGEIFTSLPSGSKKYYAVEHFETCIGLSNDSVLDLILDPQALKDRPDLFEEII